MFCRLAQTAQMRGQANKTRDRTESPMMNKKRFYVGANAGPELICYVASATGFASPELSFPTQSFF